MTCFTCGTMITTLRGEVAVEALSIGDRVVTRDNGLKTIRRISRRDFGYGQMSAAPHLQPMLIGMGALGKGLPERDMLVSPNLRMRVGAEHFPISGVQVPGAQEALVAAKNLANSGSIRPCSVLGVSYVLIEFDQTECVLANGTWAEAFCQSDDHAGAGTNAQRNELRELFPGRSNSRTIGQSA